MLIEGRDMFSIGEFSRISGHSIKALRLYHEKGILVPHAVDESTGYRYYDAANAERARIIGRLKEMEFSLTEMAAILAGVSDGADALKFLEDKRAEILAEIKQHKQAVNNLEEIIAREKEAVMTAQNGSFEVEEKNLETILIAGVRYKGRYDEFGQKFGAVARAAGRFMAGNPMSLYYDEDVKEDHADIEAAVPVRKGEDQGDVKVRELPGGQAVTLIHKGPYDTLTRSYEKITAYVKDRGYKVSLPTREIYVKGPGMILKGNPENYLTEIQMMVEK